MATYVLRRLIQAIPILFGISVISFLHRPPRSGRSGGPLPVRPRVPPETIENLIRLYGLDKPLPRAVRAVVHRLLAVPCRVDAWGYSFVDGRPVIEKIFERPRRPSC